MTNAERTYTVSGMTCGHCALSVREEVREVAGVDHVEVALDSGRLTVGGTDFSDDDVRTAVAGAGYELAIATASGGPGGGADP